MGTAEQDQLRERGGDDDEEHHDLPRPFVRQQPDQKIANAGGTKQIEDDEQRERKWRPKGNVGIQEEADGRARQYQ